MKEKYPLKTHNFVPNPQQRKKKTKLSLGVLLPFLINLLTGCNFRLQLIEDKNNTQLSPRVFDNSPPRVIVLYPTESSTLSNFVTILGKTEDESETITYLEIGHIKVIFTNQKEWWLEVNTYEFTNGAVKLEVFAEDSVKNVSERLSINYYISNRLYITVSPPFFIITNTNFYVEIILNLTNYSELRVYTNSSLLLRTNCVTNLRIPVSSVEFEENKTNEVLIAVEGITNRVRWMFDLLQPNFRVLTESNSYVYGSSSRIFVEVIDSNAVYVAVEHNNVTNWNLFETSGTNSILLNTYILTNGTNLVKLWCKDIAGNSSQLISLPLIVANYFSHELNKTLSRRYYFVNSEVTLNGIRLFFTDSSFSSIFIAKEENNFSKERVYPGSLNILPTGKIRTIADENLIAVGYIREDGRVIIRTNANSWLTNYYQLANLGPAIDFDLTRVGNKNYVLRVLSNSNFIVTDLSNKTTNFVTNAEGVYRVEAEKYPELGKLLYCLYGDTKLIVFTNTGVAFFTNTWGIDKVGIVSFTNGEIHTAWVFSNRVNILISREDGILTNFSLSLPNTVYDIAGGRYGVRSLWAIIEWDRDYRTFLRLIEVNKDRIIREQVIECNGFLSTYSIYSRDITSVYSNSVKIFVPLYSGNYGMIMMFTGL